MPLVDDLATAVVVEIKNVLGPTVDRLKTLEATVARLQQLDAALLLAREVGPVRERLAALEARPPVPGPPGAAGAAGTDGAPGPKGDPGMRYRGVYVDAAAYAIGDVVTWAGGAWHCNEATVEKPGDGSHVWTLMVKRGRDAKGAR
jgi:hypothetical protein